MIIFRVNQEAINKGILNELKKDGWLLNGLSKTGNNLNYWYIKGKELLQVWVDNRIKGFCFKEVK